MSKFLAVGGLITAGVLLWLMAGFSSVAAQSQTITISETEFKLTPDTFTVQAGVPVQVTVTDNGQVQHNLKFELPSKNIEKTLFDTNLNPGETRTAQFTFTEAGDWEVLCPVDDHASAGMKGTVHVTAAAGAAAPTQATMSATTAPASSATPTASAPSTAQAATPTSSSPSTAPTTGADPGSTAVLAMGALGALLAGAGFALRGWRVQK